jgi:hypothetical protein
METRARRSMRSRHATVVLPAQFADVCIGSRSDDGMEDVHINGTAPAATLPVWRHRTGRSPSGHPPFQRSAVHSEQTGELGVWAFTTFVRPYRSFSKRHVVRIWHGAITVHFCGQLKWDKGLSVFLRKT